jgi:dimethylargininase
MLTAITRLPGPELARCELTHLARQPIDPARALAQHRGYCDALRERGVAVVELPAEAAFPDGVFVEDTAIVLDEVAVLGAPGPVSRRGEVVTIDAALRPYRAVQWLPAGVCVEGGDVLRVGGTLLVGKGGRTDAAGLLALGEAVRPLGYRVVPVAVTGCLHFKTGCCALDEETLLINRAWVDAGSLGAYRLVDVPDEEPWGANVLRVAGTVFVSAAYPRTAALVRSLGHDVVVLDVSEFHKAEAALTCLSLLFVDS